MIHPVLPPQCGSQLPLPFYLAMEEHLARNYPGYDFFFLWQVDPTVIFGRCQNPFTEVNLDFCRQEGIATFRRKSGGGCVYADRSNIMMSHVTTPEAPVTTVFARYCSMVADTLRSLGLDAEANGRNDILISGQKVSGNAFYHLHGRSIVHGTMLYDADLPRMSAALTPSRAKLHAKGVSSVRSHVTTIHQHLPALSLEDFKSTVLHSLCSEELHLTPDDAEAIDRLSRKYYTDEWIWSRFGHIGTAPSPRRRIDGVGEFSVSVDLLPPEVEDKSDKSQNPEAEGPPPRIRRVNLQGDFFLLADLDAELLDHLKGVPYTRPAILAALAATHPEAVIPGLTPSLLADLLMQNA